MTERSLLIILLCLTLPPWLLAGFGDWLCHRRSRIERTSGPRESAMHVLLYLLIAAPLAFGLFLEIDATLLAFMAACVVAHTAVSLWDTGFAQPRRHISPLEQHIHSYLEMLPLFALALVFILHWDAVLNPAWTLSARQHALPLAWAWGVLLALVPGLLLIVEELLRCLRAARHL
ncbi:MAG TPA: hypothetical protein VFU13_15095 [Steroidobacteraceae bacterium]|nr:hypothetical protein [Steroidobacteraceae bacterium]